MRRTSRRAVARRVLVSDAGSGSSGLAGLRSRGPRQPPLAFSSFLSATMHSFRYSHFPDDCSAVHVALFTNVKNSADTRSRIVRASQLEGPDGETEREAVNFAFVDARLVRPVLRFPIGGILK